MELFYRQAVLAEKLGPAPLEKTQISCMVNNAAGIGIFIVNAEFH
jgi:hypothetical protein